MAKVAINLVGAGSGGAYAVAQEFVTRLPASGRHEFIVITKEADTDLWANLLERGRVLPVRGLNGPIRRAVWEHVALPRRLQREGAALLFSPFGSLPFWLPREVRSVVLIQNMLPFSQAASEYSGRARLRLHILERQFVSAARRADAVVVNCEWCREQLTARTPGVAPRIHVVPFAQGERGYGNQGPPDGLRTGEYLLYVSPLTPYKRQHQVVRGYAQAFPDAASRPPLVLVGVDAGSYADEVRELVNRVGLAASVQIVGFVSPGMLEAYYRNCGAFVFASTVESCPNVLLEAMTRGLPVVCSNRPPMPEYAGQAVLYFDPDSPEEIARSLRTIWNGDMADEYRERARRQGSLFSWDWAAARLDEIFDVVVQDRAS